MSVFNVNDNISKTDNTIRLDKEKEDIIRFLTQYTKLYEFDKFRGADIPVAPLSKEDRLAHMSGRYYRWMSMSHVNLTSDANTFFDPKITVHTEERKCTDVYLQLVDNHWIIVPFDYDLPVGIFNYFGDSFPDFIRFANGTSVCRITTGGPPTTNYGYHVPQDDDD